MAKLPHNADRIIIATNPRAGSGKGRDLLEKFIDSVATRGWQMEVLKKRDEVSQLAEQWQQEGSLRAVVAAGGDGTVSGLANCLSPDIPLIPIPTGTENLLARYLGIRNNADAISRVIADGLITKVDAGRAGDRIFLLVASAGFDAQVVDTLHEGRKGNISHFSYFKPIWQTLRTYEYPPIDIEYVEREGARWERLTARWVFVFNLPCYAFRLKFVPDAKPNDGRLHVCAFEKGTWTNAFRYLFQVILGMHKKSSECQIFPVTKLRLKSDSPVKWEADGDPAGALPLEMEILPQRTTLIVPQKWASKHNVEE